MLSILALGIWQVQRRAWKLDLIERVEGRVHAAPVPAPGPQDWGRLSAAGDEYRHVRLQGRFLHDRRTLVQAATELGSGYWVLTPLQTADGSVVLVNRGFVAAAPAAAAADAAPVTITGLLRMSEPPTYLRRNDAQAGRWRTRDVAAIAAARGLQRVAPYFVDADGAPRAAAGTADPGAPVGGLTVIAFRNDHLEYALTWFALAALTLVGAAVVYRAAPDAGAQP